MMDNKETRVFMSTIQEFENAPVGATAKKGVGLVAIREGYETDQYPWVCTTYGELLSNWELAKRGYTLVPSAPTTAQEARDLAWDLAHPVKEGQHIPEGTEFLYPMSDGTYMNERIGVEDYRANGSDEKYLRTLDPLPDPEPDWLDATVILANCPVCLLDNPLLPEEGTDNLTWECRGCRCSMAWDSLKDVTPLYPKEDKGGMYITGPGNIQIKDRNGQTVWEV